MAKQFSGDAAEKPTEEVAAKLEPQLTLEQVRAVLADKSRAGHTAVVRELLLKYGASKLSQTDPANYEALLREAEVLGNTT
ncbi:DNA ligase [[Clostridium] innocuum]|nr:DNA ligase [[Clostridium] innocuum]